jgi:hypothetical protein
MSNHNSFHHNSSGNLKSDSYMQEQEIWDNLTSQFFKVESELQLISVLSFVFHF